MPKNYIFTQETFIEQPLETVFEFFSQAENLDKITPKFLKFQFITPLPIEIKENTHIDYKLHLMGVPFKWKTLISVWQPPHKFVDIQLKGPYKKWEHTHEFKEMDGGTLMTDRVEYQLPFSIFGRMAHGIFVEQQIKDIFAYRKEMMKVFFQ